MKNTGWMHRTTIPEACCVCQQGERGLFVGWCSHSLFGVEAHDGYAICRECVEQRRPHERFPFQLHYGAQQWEAFLTVEGSATFWEAQLGVLRENAWYVHTCTIEKPQEEEQR